MEYPRSTLLSVGEVFHGQYEVRRPLAVGGMSIVYEVTHTATHRAGALKIMTPRMIAEPAMRDRFLREASVASEIESEAIVKVLDAGIDDATGSPFLVMELLRGEDLESHLQKRGPHPPAEVVALLAQVAPAVDAMHGAHIVHRDLKPGNLFLAGAADRPPSLKIIDFGIAKIQATCAPAPTTRNLGTPLYMSPEQVRGDGDIGPRADLYALGHVAYTLLAGAPYWSEEAERGGRVLYDQVLEGAPEPATRRAERRGVTLPPAFDAWFDRATAVEPEDRFENAEDCAGALARALDVPWDPRARPALPITRPRGRRPARLLIGALATAVAAGALLYPPLRARQGARGRALPAAPHTKDPLSRPPTVAPLSAAPAASTPFPAGAGGGAPDTPAQPITTARDTPAEPIPSAHPRVSPARPKPPLPKPSSPPSPFGRAVL